MTAGHSAGPSGELSAIFWSDPRFRVPRPLTTFPRACILCVVSEDDFMSKIKVDIEALKAVDTKALHELDVSVMSALDREVRDRREAKRNGKKKRKRAPRRSS